MLLSSIRKEDSEAAHAEIMRAIVTCGAVVTYHHYSTLAGSKRTRAKLHADMSIMLAILSGEIPLLAQGAALPEASSVQTTYAADADDDEDDSAASPADSYVDGVAYPRNRTDAPPQALVTSEAVQVANQPMGTLSYCTVYVDCYPTAYQYVIAERWLTPYLKQAAAASKAEHYSQLATGTAGRIVAGMLAQAAGNNAFPRHLVFRTDNAELTPVLAWFRGNAANVVEAV